MGKNKAAGQQINHAGHRQRQRTAYFENGIEVMTAYEVLEMLLFASIPVRDTQVFARLLLRRFGSIGQVLDAQIEELVQSEGIRENSAIWLKVAGELCKRYAYGEREDPILLDSAEAATTYVTSLFSRDEDTNKKITLYMLMMDDACRLLRSVKIGTYSIEPLRTEMDTFIHLISSSHASSIMLAHSHPSRPLVPNYDDLLFSWETASLLKSMNVKFVDHFLTNGEESFPMSKADAAFSIYFTV